MKVRTIPLRKFRMGAEELIEMGGIKKPSSADRRPFLSGRSRKNSLGAEELIEMGAGRRRSLGDLVDLTGNTAPYLASVLSMASDLLSDLAGKPVEDLAQGADVAYGAFSDLIAKIPALSDLYAEVLLSGCALARLGLSVPGLSVRGLGNILAGVAKALGQRTGSGDNQKSVDMAMKIVIASAPDEISADVKTVLEASGVSGGNLSPCADLETGVVTPEATPTGAQG